MFMTSRFREIAVRSVPCMNRRIRSRLFFDATYGEFSSLFHPRAYESVFASKEETKERGGFCKGRALKAAKMPHPSLATRSAFQRNFCEVICCRPQ